MLAGEPPEAFHLSLSLILLPGAFEVLQGRAGSPPARRAQVEGVRLGAGASQHSQLEAHLNR